MSEITLELLAQDVLKYLDPATRGNVRLDPQSDYGYCRVEDDSSAIQLNLKEAALAGKTCHVCALGALAVAKAIRGTEINLRPMGPGQFNMFFPPNLPCEKTITLGRIERAFDTWYEMSGEAPTSAVERLKAVCNAIIEGKFNA